MEEKNVKTKVEAGLFAVSESLSSVKLVRTAGGEVRPEVKVYHSDPIEAMRLAQEIMDKLNEKYKVNE